MSVKDPCVLGTIVILWGSLVTFGIHKVQCYSILGINLGSSKFIFVFGWSFGNPWGLLGIIRVLLGFIGASKGFYGVHWVFIRQKVAPKKKISNKSYKQMIPSNWSTDVWFIWPTSIRKTTHARTCASARPVAHQHTDNFDDLSPINTNVLTCKQNRRSSTFSDNI